MLVIITLKKTWLNYTPDTLFFFGKNYCTKDILSFCISIFLTGSPLYTIRVINYLMLPNLD